VHLPWHLPSHNIILRPTLRHTHQTKENDTIASMPPNIDASPFCNFFCLHVVESKNSQPPTKKKKNPKLLSIHTQPKARNLLQGIHSHLLLCVQVKSQIGHEDLPL